MGREEEKSDWGKKRKSGRSPAPSPDNIIS